MFSSFYFFNNEKGGHFSNFLLKKLAQKPCFINQRYITICIRTGYVSNLIQVKAPEGQK